jgi:replicative superfamily II helicase
MIEQLAIDVLNDNYFIELNNKIAKLFAGKFFSENITQELTKKEFADILRFADILSNAKTTEARNKAYQIITLLNESYQTNPFYKTVSHSVLAKLGNFPGIHFLKTKNNNNSELPFEYEIEKMIKEIRQTVPHTSDLIFTDTQFALYNKIIESKHFSFSGPTSMGKSFIIKSFIRKIIENKPPENIVIMVPTRALINQFSMDINKEMKVSLESYNYVIITNSNLSESYKLEERHYIFVLTPERLLSFLSKKDNPQFAYLFVDEAHKLATDKDTRSITAYTAISNSLRKNPNLGLYFSSPNVSNPETFLKLFKKDEKLIFMTKESPVFQNRFFIDFTNKMVTHYLDTTNYSFKSNLVDKSENIIDIISRLGQSGNNIIYCSSKKELFSKCDALYKNIQNVQYIASKNVNKTIRLVKESIHNEYYLADYLEKGIAYHFGNLPQIIRNKVETLFRAREINYVFCTSTLLEGVNLPAKNVFILNNKKGNYEFLPIDFWNLAGRAGRLKMELSGNIVCLKEDNRSWKDAEELLKNRKDIIVNASIENFIDKELKNIEQILCENSKIPFETKLIKEILEYIANIINIDTLEIKRSNYKSEVINKLIQENKATIIELAKKNSQKIEVPSAILNANYSIKLKIQNSAYIFLKGKSNQSDEIKLPSRITYELCKKQLYLFYDIFNWNTEETKNIRSKKQLDYYAVLMYQWMSGSSLNHIINNSISHHFSEKIEINVSNYKTGQREVFDNSKRHINIVIGKVIEEIENILRFTFEKYFNIYYLMLVEILGEEKAGVNWATFLEYGTQDSVVMALQNIGLSRHTSFYLFKNHKDCLKIEKGNFIGVDAEKLKKDIDKERIEYEEICDYFVI